MKKLRMLPHFWMWIGLALLWAGIVLSAAIYIPNIIAGLRNPDMINYGELNIGMLGYRLAIPLGLVIISLSRETIEDELVTAVRHNALMITAFTYIALLLSGPLRTLMRMALTRYYMPSRMAVFDMLHNEPLILLGVYLLVFRITIWKQKKNINYEE